MNSNLETILNNIRPLSGAAAAVLVIVLLGKTAWDSKLDGKKILVSLLWYCPFVAIAANPVMILKIGNMFIKIVTGLLSMLGFGGLE